MRVAIITENFLPSLSKAHCQNRYEAMECLVRGYEEVINAIQMLMGSIRRERGRIQYFALFLLSPDKLVNGVPTKRACELCPYE